MNRSFPEPSVPLILASGSPRRREILKQLGYTFEVIAPKIEEIVPKDVAPQEVVRRLAEEKALTVSRMRGEAAVLGCDTVVVLDGKILGKPSDLEDARRMLWSLSGRTHEVWSGIALARSETIAGSSSVLTRVTFSAYGDDEIEFQLATGEPLDKAGAYGIQSVGARLAERLDGCFYNVVGMPIFATVALIESVSLR